MHLHVTVRTMRPAPSLEVYFIVQGLLLRSSEHGAALTALEHRTTLVMFEIFTTNFLETGVAPLETVTIFGIDVVVHELVDVTYVMVMFGCPAIQHIHNVLGCRGFFRVILHLEVSC